MVMHVNAYAKVLFRWQLLKQRAELLNSIKDQAKDWSEYRIGTAGDPRSVEVKSQPVQCTFCRLPIKGRCFFGCGSLLLTTWHRDRTFVRLHSVWTCYASEM